MTTATADRFETFVNAEKRATCAVFAPRFKAALVSAKVTVTRLAAETGMSRHQINRLATGQLTPSREQLATLAQALGMMPEQLLPGTDVPASLAPRTRRYSVEEMDDGRYWIELSRPVSRKRHDAIVHILAAQDDDDQAVEMARGCE